MTTDELVSAIENFMVEYDPYGFYDTYGVWSPNSDSHEDIRSQVAEDPAWFADWFADAAINCEDESLRDKAKDIVSALSETEVTGATDLFGEDPDFFFTRDDIVDYIEEPLQEQIPGIESCRGYIDKEDGKYVLSVDIITEDYDLTGGAAPAVTIDMRKIRKPSDLGKYLTPIIQIYNDTINSYDELADAALDPYFDDPTQYGDLDNPITPWGGSCL